jgi:hypothetical protein
MTLHFTHFRHRRRETKATPGHPAGMKRDKIMDKEHSRRLISDGLYLPDREEVNRARPEE